MTKEITQESILARASMLDGSTDDAKLDRIEETAARIVHGVAAHAGDSNYELDTRLEDLEKVLELVTNGLYDTEPVTAPAHEPDTNAQAEIDRLKELVEQLKAELAEGEETIRSIKSRAETAADLRRALDSVRRALGDDDLADDRMYVAVEKIRDALDKIRQALGEEDLDDDELADKITETIQALMERTQAADASDTSADAPKTKGDASPKLLLTPTDGQWLATILKALIDNSESLVLAVPVLKAVARKADIDDEDWEFLDKIRKQLSASE